MVLFNRLLLAAALAVGFAGAAPASTAPSTKVFEGDDVAFFLLPALDPGGVLATAVGFVSGPGGDLFEFSAGATFSLDPLGDDVTGLFLNIFDLDAAGLPANLVLEASALIGAPIVSAGPTADVPFTVSGGTILDLFGPSGLLRLSGLTGPDAFGDGTVDVEIFLAPIPLPAAAPFLLAGLAGLALVRARRRS